VGSGSGSGSASASASRTSPDPFADGINEAGGSALSEMSSARSATISSVDDIARGSWGHGQAREIQGDQIYEAPEARRHELSGWELHEAPGTGWEESG
jgi:hypothetical protein